MKRSDINKALKELEAMCQKYCCYLPPFCHFTPEEWAQKGHEYDEVRDCKLGWDITDYGMMDYFDVVDENGKNSIPELAPDETVTLQLAFVVNEFQADKLLLSLNGEGVGTSFGDRGLAIGYVDLRG